MKIFPMLLLPFLSMGCYFSKSIQDRPWDPAEVAEIQPGKTTKAEVLRRLGPPTEIVRLLESEAYIYRHPVEKQTGTFLIVLNMRRVDRQFDAITVIINREDTVTAIGSRYAAEEAEYGFPWE